MITKGQHVIITSGAFSGQHGVIVNAVKQTKTQPWAGLYRVALPGIETAWRFFSNEFEAVQGA